MEQALDPKVEQPVVETIGAPARVQSRTWLVRLVSMIVVVGGWQLLGRHVSPIFLSYPTAIFKAALVMIGSGELIAALASSLQSLAIGFTSAAVFGVLLGLLIGRYDAVDAATDWMISALNATPLIALTPLVILWFGLGQPAKIFMVFILAFFPIVINTASGVRNVPEALIDVSTAFAATERQVFVKIILPAAVPYMMTGLRLGIGRAIMGMVVAEFSTAITGLGAVIVKYGNQYDTASMFVPILLLMILGIVLTSLVRRAETHFARWREVD